MKSILAFACVGILLTSAVRLGIMARREWGQYRYSRSQNSLTPMIGSFAGIDVGGTQVRAELSGYSHLLLFVIHRNRISEDIQIWNEVVALVRQAQSESSAHIEYWGICDSGSDCKRYQPEAHFTIVGYLEPFEMRIAADAEAEGKVLLYSHGGMLEGRIPRVASPSGQANLVLRHTK